MKVPLNSGAYSNRSLVANAQSCINLFPENNPEESTPASPFTHYPRPGLLSLGKPAVQGRGRGLYRASNGDLYGVVGATVYFIDKNFIFNSIGTIQNQFTPVSLTVSGNTQHMYSMTQITINSSPSGTVTVYGYTTDATGSTIATGVRVYLRMDIPPSTAAFTCPFAPE